MYQDNRFEGTASRQKLGYFSLIKYFGFMLLMLSVSYIPGVGVVPMQHFTELGCVGHFPDKVFPSQSPSSLQSPPSAAQAASYRIVHDESFVRSTLVS